MENGHMIEEGLAKGCKVCEEYNRSLGGGGHRQLYHAGGMGEVADRKESTPSQSPPFQRELKKEEEATPVAPGETYTLADGLVDFPRMAQGVCDPPNVPEDPEVYPPWSQYAGARRGPGVTLTLKEEHCSVCGGPWLRPQGHCYQRCWRAFPLLRAP